MQEFRGKLQKVIKKANPDIDWGVFNNYNNYYYNNRKEESKSGSDELPSPRGMFEAMSTADSDYSSRGSSSNYSSLHSPGNRPPSPPGPGLPKANSTKGDVNGQQQWKVMIDVLRFKNVRRFSNIPLLAASYEISRKNLRKKVARKRDGEDDDDLPIDLDSIPTKPSWRNFPYADLAAATDNFSPENMLGKGGHAEVYRGCLPDGQIVAVKRLMMNDEKEIEDQVGDFLSELGIIAHINHPNAALLLGFGIEKGLYFVLQYAPRGSLSSLLFGSQGLEWKARFKVALGVAKGLKYLHHDCPRRIIHRDIKASNILLDNNYEAEISDFGLAKWLPDQWEHHVVFPIEGTFGYLAPEYFMHGLVDEKTDVFAFGVLLLELITGRRAVDSNSRESLVIWAKPLLDAKQIKEIVDPRLGDQYDLIEMKNAMTTASLCVHHKPSMRPYMNKVVKLLKGEEVAVEITQKTKSPRSLLLDACDLEDYTCSNYLNDLNRHKQLIME
ncbi:receptor-like cytosolic serine/threonine-protein kinase RBK1 [Arachis duranensis]|uniref:non-specific serine/threonine protein kinase n=1 Tax=Arachis duranensis TaxID=130453 RepID=A0A6P4CTW0_ARADU|nr:receptor-like cytosolic serine/threonine-protein kinase RBK1 [Arachis duranensis]XP_025690443.1 receptor-like cytosolic serine/threonine-protein kinase RBK1 [Arachis hypogaea]XP_057752174.1 receptor-like cytosolic serine/threonine-protein kinase RBK1 [Arachis stenosperma]